MREVGARVQTRHTDEAESPIGMRSQGGVFGQVSDETPDRPRVTKHVDLRIGRAVSDRVHEKRATSTTIRQEPAPEVEPFARPQDGSPGATGQREIQKDDGVCPAEPNLDSVVGPEVAVHNPPIFGGELLLDHRPLMGRSCGEARSPENCVQLDYRKPRDPAQAPRESRFA